MLSLILLILIWIEPWDCPGLKALNKPRVRVEAAKRILLLEHEVFLAKDHKILSELRFLDKIS